MNGYYYSAVIFDLDGTLLDTAEDLAAAVEWVCVENGWRTRTVEEVKQLVGHGVDKLVESLTPEPQTPRTHTRTVSEFSEYYRAHSMDKTRPCAGIPELLERLRTAGIRTGVCSNKPDEFTRALVTAYFPGVFGYVRGNMAGVPVKPDPAGVLTILSELGAERSRTLYVGDSATDVYTGHNAGLKVCGVSWGFRSRDSLERAAPEYLVDHAEELDRIIRTGA